MQWSNEDKALNFITKNASEMVIGYVIGPRDVKLYYTETALSMMVRRTGRLVEAMGPFNPMHAPIGLGHLVLPSGGKKNSRGTPWAPLTGDKQGVVSAPTLGWSAGNVTYGHRALPASGSLYIPNDQVPYSQQKRGYKYNHMLLQAGLELFEVLQAIGADMDTDLSCITKSSMKGNLYNPDGKNDLPAGCQLSALQILFSSIFGTVVGATNAADFTADEAGVAAGMKEMMGFLFNSGHIHVDPGVLSYKYTTKDGVLSSQSIGTGKKFCMYKGQRISAQLLMQEFVAKYVTFCMLATALRPYFSVPTWQCHWLYVGSPKPEYVTEQLQMNFRADVYYDGSDSTLPYTLIPSLLNPGQVLARLPCLFDMSEGSATSRPNSYLGIRDPQPYGPVDEIRFYGDRPVTVIEEREYTFSPIIEADASIQTTYRNGRTVNMAVWPRPSVYSPGVSRLGVIYGCLADNAKVGGHYYYQYLSGPLQNESVNDKFYRGMSDDDDKADHSYLVAGQGAKEQARQVKFWRKKEIPAEVNPQLRGENVGPPIASMIPNNPDEAQVVAPLTAVGLANAIVGEEEFVEKDPGGYN